MPYERHDSVAHRLDCLLVFHNLFFSTPPPSVTACLHAAATACGRTAPAPLPNSAASRRCRSWPLRIAAYSRSAICDCLSLNVSVSLTVPPMPSAPPRAPAAPRAPLWEMRLPAKRLGAAPEHTLPTEREKKRSPQRRLTRARRPRLSVSSFSRAPAAPRAARREPPHTSAAYCSTTMRRASSSRSHCANNGRSPPRRPPSAPYPPGTTPTAPKAC